MSQQKSKATLSLLIAIVFLTVATVISVKSQTAAEISDASQKMQTLYDQQRFVEALPYAEMMTKAVPDNGRYQFIYGFCLLGKAKTVTDKEEARQLVIKSRQSFVKSKQLGYTDKLVDALISSLPVDGILSGKFSKNEEAENAMNEAESYFVQGKMDEALKLYQKALTLDPKIYEAALFSGDVYTQKGDFANAEIWYQKAIAINPDRETAYRYSATPLMKQEKYDLARDRYIEAYIVEPFSRFSTLGIGQWAEKTNTRIGHPKIDLPEIKYDENGKANSTINVNPSADSGLIAWANYVATREAWHKEKFAKTFPNEKVYRHTLQEEADALRSVIKSAKENSGKTANPQINMLIELEDAGVLEPYILLALTDDGIYEDYYPYLKNNREKLRQYVLKFVIEH